jgi:hypothetical protein
MKIRRIKRATRKAFSRVDGQGDGASRSDSLKKQLNHFFVIVF